MRMIGHELLTCAGDRTSRVLPIEKSGEEYIISFASEFAFDPEDFITIIDRVMTASGIADHYLVETKQCASGDVVHSFIVGSNDNRDMLICKERWLPLDCYSVGITLLDHQPTHMHNDTSGIASNEHDAAADTGVTNFSPERSSIGILSVVVLIVAGLLGLAGIVFWKRKSSAPDPDVIWIGASRFSKRNMSIYYNNEKIDLSHKETELLALLHTAVNTPVEREVILQKVWGDDGDYVGRTLDVFISKLRKKLEADETVRIVNIRGIGYKLVV